MIGLYDLRLVLLSYLIAAFASYITLELAARVSDSPQHAVRRVWLLGGAFSMGSGIWSMHFVGMLAFQLPISMGYDFWLTLLSMLIAITASGYALYALCREQMNPLRLLVSGLIMGAGISAMHYTGMAAMRMSPPIQYDPWLVALSVAIAIAASSAALWIAFHLRREPDSWQTMLAKFAGALVMGLAITGMHYTGMAAARFAPGSVCGSVSIVVNNTWLATGIGVVTTTILLVTWLFSMFDRRLTLLAAADALSLRKANEDLRAMALHDPLTKLPNRSLLRDRITQAISRAKRNNSRVAVILFDIDRFKQINDNHGHSFGDVVLQSVATHLGNTLRETDTLARLGGDEFVVGVENIFDAEQANAVAQKIHASLIQPLNIPGQEIFITVSQGISHFPADGISVDDLLRKADIAMYAAKREGGNNTVCLRRIWRSVRQNRWSCRTTCGGRWSAENLKCITSRGWA
jgi:diguanylate cyclase (GGDEF)-like protein